MQAYFIHEDEPLEYIDCRDIFSRLAAQELGCAFTSTPPFCPFGDVYTPHRTPLKYSVLPYWIAFLMAHLSETVSRLSRDRLSLGGLKVLTPAVLQISQRNFWYAELAAPLLIRCTVSR